MRTQHGFTYLGLLFVVTLLGAAMAGAGSLWRTTVQRDREQELLFVGNQYRQAIIAYREKAPAGQPLAFPRSIDDLLEDKRWPTLKRHLRKAFRDPITGSTEWGLVEGPGGALTGVYSPSQAAPLKVAGFPKAYESFAGSRSYRDWQFVYGGGGAVPSAASSATSATSVQPVPAADPGR